jgi:hypothetical protein
VNKQQQLHEKQRYAAISAIDIFLVSNCTSVKFKVVKITETSLYSQQAEKAAQALASASKVWK